MKIGISRTTFRWVVVAAFLLDIFLTTYWRTDSHWLSGLPESAYDVVYDALAAINLSPTEHISGDNLALLADLSTMAHWFCYIALFFFWSVGRWILLILTVQNMFTAPFFGVSVMFGWESSISGLLGDLDIFLLALSFFSPLASEFECKETQ